MNKGKQKCNELKQIRKELAEQLNIDLHQKECTFEGNCKGTCPKCKQEEQKLNSELLKRAAVLGIGALTTLSLAGCTFNSNDISGNVTHNEKEIEEYVGGMTYTEPDETEDTSEELEKMEPLMRDMVYDEEYDSTSEDLENTDEELKEYLQNNMEHELPMGVLGPDL